MSAQATPPEKKTTEGAPGAATPPAPPVEQPPQAPPKPELTPEELEQAQNEFINYTFGGKPKAKAKPPTDDAAKKKADEDAAKKKAEEDAAAAKKKADDEAAAAKAKAETPPPAKKEVPPLPDLSGPAADPADAIADRVADRIKPQATAEPPLEMTESQRMKIEAFERMEKDGTATKGLADKVKKYWRAEDKYIADWIAAHPGEEFDAEAQDHRDWYRRNSPDYDDDAFDVAMAKNVEDRAFQRLKETSTHDQRKTDARQRLESSQPVIQKAVDSSIADFVAQAAEASTPEVAKLLVVDGKRVESLGDDKLVTQMEEADPLATEVLVEAGEPLAIMLGELERITNIEGYQPDLNRIVPLRHSEGTVAPAMQVMMFIRDLEAGKLKQDPATTLDEHGRRLVSNQFYMEAMQRISQIKDRGQREAKMNELDQRCYVLTPDMIKSEMIAAHASKAAKRIEKLKKASGGKKTETQKTETQTTTTTSGGGSQTAETATGKTKSPSVSSASDMVNTQGGVNPTEEEKQNYFLKRSFGG